jgi:hypothetical protein
LKFLRLIIEVLKMYYDYGMIIQIIKEGADMGDMVEKGTH